MSAIPSEDVKSYRAEDAELTEALVERCHLQPEDLVRISEAMRSMKTRFAEAAVHVGLLTTDDVTETVAWVSAKKAQHNSSIVERVLQRTSTSRSLVVRHPRQVQPSGRILLAHDADSARSERLRALRTEILLLTDNAGQANFLAILSPNGGDGRSQITAELAIAFAQLGRRTLLVDADLRKPSQHLLFNAPNDSGLTHALTYGEPVELFGVEGSPFLSLLPAGPRATNPLELLSSGKLSSLVNGWRYNYEFVIIDTPPVMEFSDGLAIAAIAGQVLVLGRLAMTTNSQMKNLLRRLAMTQARIIGAIANQF